MEEEEARPLLSAALNYWCPNKPTVLCQVTLGRKQVLASLGRAFSLMMLGRVNTVTLSSNNPDSLSPVAFGLSAPGPKW